MYQRCGLHSPLIRNDVRTDEDEPLSGYSERAGAGGSGRALLLWAGVAFAFSPVLADLAAHMQQHAWSRYALLFFVLFGLAARADGFEGPRGRDGYLLLALALLVDFVSVVGGVVRAGRLGIPMAVIGLSRAFGLSSIRTAALSVWMLPMPSLLNRIAGDLGLPALQLKIAHAVLSPLTQLHVRGWTLEGSHGGFELSSSDAGLPVVALFSGLAWYTAAREGLGGPETLKRLGLWCALGLAVQTGCVVLAAGGAAAGQPLVARFALEGPLVACIAACLLWRSHARRRVLAGRA